MDVIIPLSDTKPTILRYQLVIHNGLEAEAIAKLDSHYRS